MIDRRCFRCDYDLAGLPRPEGVVICPECGFEHAPLNPMVHAPIRWFRPYLWGMVPAAVAIVVLMLLPWRLRDTLEGPLTLCTLGLCGHITARKMRSLLDEEDLRRLLRRSRWELLIPVIVSAVVAIVLNGLLLLFTVGMFSSGHFSHRG